MKKYLISIICLVLLSSVAYGAEPKNAANKLQQTIINIVDQDSCTAAGFTWNNVNSCIVPNGYILDASTQINIPGPAILAINNTVTVNGTLNALSTNCPIMITGSLIISSTGVVSTGTSGTIIVMVGKIDNYGTFNNAGALVFNMLNQNTNPGTFINESGATLNNSGSIGNPIPLGPTLLTTFNMTNSGTINNQSGGMLLVNRVKNYQVNNFSNLININQGIINNAGTINSDGNIAINSGSLSNAANATIINGYYVGPPGYVGSISNGGTITNSGKIVNNANGITTSGTFTNNAGGTIVMSSNFTNSGEFYNFGTVNDTGNVDPVVVTNSGIIINQSTGIMAFINQYMNINNNPSGMILNFGTFSNSFLIKNYGTIANSGGTFNNNLQRGTVYNYTTINNIHNGNIVNNGQFDNMGTLNNCGSQITGTSPINDNPPVSCSSI